MGTAFAVPSGQDNDIDLSAGLVPKGTSAGGGAVPDDGIDLSAGLVPRGDGHAPMTKPAQPATPPPSAPPTPDPNQPQMSAYSPSLVERGENFLRNSPIGHAIQSTFPGAPAWMKPTTRAGTPEYEAEQQQFRPEQLVEGITQPQVEQFAGKAAAVLPHLAVGDAAGAVEAARTPTPAIGLPSGVARATPAASATPAESVAVGAANRAGDLTSAPAVAQMAGLAAATGGVGELLGPALEGLGLGLSAQGTALAEKLTHSLIGAGFTTQMGVGLIKQVPEYRKALNDGDEKKAHEILGGMLVDGTLAAMAGVGTAAGVHGAVKDARTPAPEVQPTPEEIHAQAVEASQVKPKDGTRTFTAAATADTMAARRAQSSEVAPEGGDRPVMQASDDPAAVRASAAAQKDALEAMAAQAVDGVDGAKVEGARVKDADSQANKEERGKPTATNIDHLGARVSAETPEALKQVQRNIREQLPVVGEEPIDSNGLTAQQFAVQTGRPGEPNQVSELQVVNKPQADAMKETDELYDQQKKALAAGDTDEAERLGQQITARHEAAQREFEAAAAQPVGPRGLQKGAQVVTQGYPGVPDGTQAVVVYWNMVPDAKGQPLNTGRGYAVKPEFAGRADLDLDSTEWRGKRLGEMSKDNVRVPAAKAEPKYQFGSTQANLPEDSPAHEAVMRLQERIPEADLAGDGKDIDKPHVTVRYGLKDGLTTKLRSFIEAQAPFEARLGKTTSFPPSENSDGAAPIIAPVESPELHRLNAAIEKQGEFEPFSFPEYKPHVTVAYVKPELAAKYTGMTETEGKTFPVRSVAISDRDGHHTEIPLRGEAAPKAPEAEVPASQRDASAGEQWIGVDLDGTLAHYDGYKGPEVIGKPVPEMVDRVKQWLADGKKVKIFTARVANDPGGVARAAIERWSEEHLGETLPITNVKDEKMGQLWDDRAVQVSRNAGTPLGNPEEAANHGEQGKADDVAPSEQATNGDDSRPAANEAVGGNGTEEPVSRTRERGQDSRGEGKYPAGYVGRVPISELHVDPKRFQYKMNVDAGGATNKLRDVRWDEDRGGIIHVWRDPADGKLYVVNGHHRFDLARRGGAAEMVVKVYGPEVRTPEQARAKGALQNISDGTGTATEAAQFLLDSGWTAEELKKNNVSLMGAVADGGVGLAQLGRLSRPLFDAVVRGQLPEKAGVAIGKAAKTAAQAEALATAIERAEAKGKPVTEATLRELARQAEMAGETSVQTMDLFGNSERSVGLALEVADVSSYVRRKISTEKKLFGGLTSANKAEALAQADNTINTAKNKTVAERAAGAAELYDRLSARTGPVYDALQRAAKEIVSGGDERAVKERAYTDIRAAVAGLVRRGAQDAAAELAQGQPPEPGDGGVPKKELARAKTETPAAASKPEAAVSRAARPSAEERMRQLRDEMRAKGKDVKTAAELESPAKPTAKELEDEGQTPLFKRGKVETPALPGMEGDAARQAASADDLRAEQQREGVEQSLRSAKGDVSKAAGQMERESPLFYGSEAGGQGTLFQRVAEGMDEDREARRQNPWYLKSERVLEQKMKGPMPGTALLRMLENAGVKAEELKWSGLEDLRGRDRVTPAEVREYLAENAVKVQEVFKGEPPPSMSADASGSVLEREAGNRDQPAGGATTARDETIASRPLPQDATPEQKMAYELFEQGAPGRASWTNALLDRAIQDRGGPSGYQNQREIIREVRALEAAHAELHAPVAPPGGWPEDHDPTKFDSYQLPGGANYRELLLTLPSREPAGGNSWTSVPGGTTQDFRANHWDEPNVVAHIRFNDRTTPDGKKLLHLEEIQSDWHQKGRDKGYQNPAAEKEMQAALDAQKAAEKRLRDATAIRNEAYHKLQEDSPTAAVYDAYFAANAAEEAATKDAREAADAYAAARKEAGASGVPDAPFKKDWQEMAFRRAVKYAADNGYDGVSWTPGEKQNERYALSKQISELNVFRRNDGSSYDLSARQTNGSRADIASNVTPEKLADWVGKDMARKILDDESGQRDGERESNIGGKGTWKTYSGLDLEVGGAGMKGFYDKIIPDYARKFGKQWGAKVGETEIGAKSEDASGRGFDREGVKVPLLEITPEMRQQVREQGVPLFQRTPEYEAAAQRSPAINARRAKAEVGDNAVGKHVTLNDDGHRVVVRGLQSFEPTAPDYWHGAMLSSEQAIALIDALKRDAAAHAKKGDLLAHRGTKALMRAIESARNEDGHTILYAPNPDVATTTEEVTHLYQVTDDLQAAVVRAMMPVTEPVEARLQELGYPKLSAADLVAEVTAKAIANDAEVQWSPGERAQVVEAYKAALQAHGVPMDRLPAMREDGESEAAGDDDERNALQDAAGQGSGGTGAERGAEGAAREGADADGDAAGGPAKNGQAKPRPDGKTLLKRAVDKARAEKQANGEPDAEKDQRDLVGYVGKAQRGLSDDADYRVPAIEEPKNTEPKTQGKAVAQPLGKVRVKTAPELAGPTALDRLRRRMGNIPEAKRGFGERRAAEVAGAAKAIQEDTQRALETLKGLRGTVQGAWDLLRNKPKPDTPASQLFGEYEKGLQMDAIASHQFAKRFKAVVPEEERRVGITNWIQAGGDVDTLANWERGSTDAKLRAGYKAAQSLTPDELAMAKELKAYYDENNKEDLAAGFYDQAKANYMMQVYEADAQPYIQSVLSGSTMQPEPGIFKHSQFRNYFEAESAGKKPRNKDAAVLTLDYDRQRSEALRGRAYIRGILNMREADGRPSAILKREGEIMQIGKENEPYLVDWNDLRDDGKDPYRMDYRHMPVPAMSGWLWQVGDLDLEDMRPSEVTRYNDADGAIALRGNVWLHPEAFKRLKPVFEKSLIREFEVKGVKVGKAMLTASQLVKDSLFVFAGTHQMIETAQAVSHGTIPINLDALRKTVTFKSLENPLNLPDDILDVTAGPDAKIKQLALSNGLVMMAPMGEEGLSEVALRGAARYLGPVGEALRDYQYWLFNDLIPKLKMTDAVRRYKQEVKSFRYRTKLAKGEITENQIMQNVARQVNSNYGGINWRRMGLSPTVVDLARLMFLAPDFLYGEVSEYAQAVRPHGYQQRKALLRAALVMYTTARVVNYFANDGDTKNDLDHAFTVVYKGKNYGIRTRPGDLVSLLSDPRLYVSHRLNPAVGAATEALTGKDEYGRAKTATQSLKDAVMKPVPIFLQPLLKNQDLDWQQTLLGAMGIREGMYYTPAETLAHRLRIGHAPANPQERTDEQEASSRTARHLKNDLRSGKVSSSDVWQAVQDKKITPHQAGLIMREAHETQLVEDTKSLGVEEAMKVYAKANPQEREDLRPVLAVKRRLVTPNSDEEARLEKLLGQ